MFHTLFRFLLRPLISEAAYRSNVNKIDSEPVLAEEALVHAKSDSVDLFIIHFYVSARDTVVNCEVPYEIWRDLEMKKRGTLTHQGGLFYSFETQDAIYCEESLYPPAPST